jgi:hypothetical protein
MHILFLFVVKNRDLYTTSQEIRGFNTSYNNNLHLSMANLTTFPNVAFFFGGGGGVYLTTTQQKNKIYLIK